MADIVKNHEIFIQNVNITLEEALTRAVTEVTAIAKRTDTYTDRTNSLRSSIGFVLFKDGQKLSGSFQKSGTGIEGNGSTGTQRGEEFADEIASKYPTGYVTVFVAGMNYAAYVEAKGYDVITGATMEFDSILSRQLQDIKEVTGIEFNRAE